MAKSTIKNMNIKGISIVLGEDKRSFIDYPLWWGESEIQRKKLQSTIGFETTFIARKNTTTADLCKLASKNILRALDIENSSIDAIISITQTPNYHIPGNAHILHKQLGLHKNCIALDMEFGCSGFVYGLYMAGMILNSSLKRVLLVVGDTLSKCIDANDKAIAPIFSDAGSACVIDFNSDISHSYFILKSNGRGLEHLCKKAGGYKIIDKRNLNTEYLYMNGAEIFNFTLLEQPLLIDEMLESSKLTKEQIDFFVFHQANNYILQTLLKKAQIPTQKVPSVFSKYGNCNGASIPSAICEELNDKFNTRKKVFMQGFGVGLSWGACIIDMENTLCLKPQIYKGEYNE